MGKPGRRAKAPGRQHSATSRPAARQILLVDDEPGLRQLLLTTLAAPEFTIAQASSGEQALQMTRELHPDLVILDVHLHPAHPDGLEVCRQIKSDPATTASRVMMLTADVLSAERQTAEAFGAGLLFHQTFQPACPA